MYKTKAADTQHYTTFSREEHLDESRNHHAEQCILIFKTIPPKIWIKLKLIQSAVYTSKIVTFHSDSFVQFVL